MLSLVNLLVFNLLISGGCVLCGDSTIEDAVSTGPFFRIQLMLSDQCIKMFGGPKQQLFVKSETLDRISLRNEKIASLVKDVTINTSEAEAKTIMQQVVAAQLKILMQVESDLVAILSDSEYERIVSLQLGFVGLQGFDDKVLAGYLKLEDEQAQKMKEIVDRQGPSQLSEKTRKELDSKLCQVLNAAQLAKYRSACEEVSIFRETNRKAKESAAKELDSGIKVGK